MIHVTKATVKWDSIAGVTLWEIRKDGVKVSTSKSTTQTAVVSFDNDTVVEIVDLPDRRETQILHLTQTVGG